jgi:hypothetical protein
MAEWEAWRGPHCLGYVRHYFQIRNVEHPLYRKMNRALCRYWIARLREQRRCT